MKFNQKLKLYLFKDRQWVDLSVKVTDDYVITYHMSVQILDKILDQWTNPHGGFDERIEPGYKITVQYKTQTPRPECANANYVRFSVFKNGITHNHRLEYNDILYLQKELFYQKNNQMHWD